MAEPKRYSDLDCVPTCLSAAMEEGMAELKRDIVI